MNRGRSPVHGRRGEQGEKDARGVLSVCKAGDSADLYRTCNQNSGDHVYTSDAGERDGLKAAGWTDEGVAFRVD